MSISGGGIGPAKADDDLSNCEDREPRFSFVMIVLNGMPFIEYSLKSVYDFAHEIIIIEGAVENCMFAANADGSSTDGTVEFIQSFGDPQNKVKLVRGRWPEKCEMQNEALKHVTGDYVWLIDSDEVYKRGDLKKIKEILRSDPSITQVNFIPDSFWKGLDYIFVSSKFFEDSCHYRRLFKYVPGSMFTTHRPPTMVWPGSNRTTEQINLLDGTATRAMGITFNHYSYVLDKQVKQKIELYHRYGWGRQWNLDLGRWYEECFLKWTPQNRQEIDSQYPIWTGDINSRTQIFNGTHPEVMKDFRNEQGRKEYWPEGHSLSVIGKTDYQKKVLDAWRYIKIDAPLQSRRRVMTENIEQGRAFWNIHVALAFLADRLRPQNYLEVGVRTGGSLIPLVHNCDVKKVVGVDMWLANYSGLYNSMEYAAGQISRYKTATGKRFEIELIKGDSHSALKDLIASGRRFSLITVDGDHSEAGAWEDLQDAVELLGDEGAIVFDDIIHPAHLFLNGLVDRLVEKYPFFQVLINSEQDNGCAVFLKKIDPAELLQERGVEASHSKTDCYEPVAGGELPIATDFNSRTQIFTGTHPEVMKDFAERYSFSETGRQQTTLPAPDKGIVQAESAITDPMERLRRRPQYLKIETTNICNADCAFCAYRFMQRKKGAMSMDLFKKVIDDYVAIGGGALTMSPLVGDCLVDAKFVERLRYCRGFNEITHIGFHTNHIALSRWTDEQILEILDIVDDWNCSIGPNRDVYRDMFGVDKFEEVVANLERLHELISVSEHKPRVQLNGRAAAGPFEEDERLRRLSWDLAGREIHWNTSYCDWGGLLGDLPRNTPVERADRLGEKRLPCMKSLISAVVFCDGRVGFCGCADFDALLTIGDANIQKLGDILAGQERLKLLDSFGKPWLNEYCRKCSFYEPMDIELISKWAEGTNPYHPEPIRPSLERGRRKHLVGQFAEKLEPSAYQPDNVTAFSNTPPVTAKAKSVLWIRTDSIGDNVLASSMLPHIRQEYEGARITVVCQEHIAELYEACPYVDDIVAFDKKRALLDDRYREEIVMRLRALKPDVSLNSVYSREALTDWFAIKCGAERRIAFNGSLCNISAELRDMHNQFYTDLLPSHGTHKLELERSKDFLRGLGIEAADLQPMVWTTAEDETFAEKFFHDNGLSAGNTIALFPSAQHSEKIYEQYKSVLQDFDEFSFVILGGKDAEGYAGEICSGLPQKCWNLAGRTTIRQMAAIIRRCCLYLGSDSAGAHIACAVGVPSVVVLGGGHFGRFMPYSPLTSVVCLPLECYGCSWGCRYENPHCVKDVAPTVVAEALRQSFAEPSHKIRVFMQGDSLWKPSAGQPAWKTAEQFLQTDNTEIVSIEDRGDVTQWGGGSLDIHIAEPQRLPDAGWRSDVETPAGAPMTIATSIAPKEIKKQAKAIESWRKLGFRVVSINCIEEITVLRQSFPNVEFVPAKRDAREILGKPLIYFDDFLEYFRETNCEFCGIVNSDVLLAGNEGIVSYIQSQAKGSMVYGSRTDVESLEHLDGEVYQNGFDFFFFDKSLISCFARSEFCLGMPWWDYWAPLIPMLEGFPVKRLISPLAYHILHQLDWDEKNWLLFAKKFFGHLLERMDAEMISNPQSLWASLGRTYETHHSRYLKERGMEYTTLMSVGLIWPCVFEFLGRQSQEIEYKSIQPAVPQHSPAIFRNNMDMSVGKIDSTMQLHDARKTECDVSIVLCTKDRAELLDAMLNSLEEAACGIVYELIVVEGGSSDNTLDVLRRHNVWNVYDESQHLGPGRHSWPKLYNFGFSKARGKWAMYASDDIVFGPNSIARAVEMLDRQKEEVAGGVFFYKNLHPTRQEWAEYGIDFTHGNKLLLNYGLVRLDRFRECGGLEECYNFYCADTDLCYKLYERGHELIPLGGCFVTHDNLLDVQKQANACRGARDIEMCQRRWRHFVPADLPSPTRLLWRDELAEAFDVPSELERIDSGIESVWRGLAYFGQAMFAEAEQEFIRAVQSRCDHRQVLWHLALAADKCQDNAIVEKAAAGVVRLKPDFEPALELLLRVTGAEQYSPERALCSAASGSVSPVYRFAGSRR